MKHINLDLIRVTEAAAIAASRLIGSGKKEEIDYVATEAMRNRLNLLPFAGQIKLCEGIKDKSACLYKDEKVGCLWNDEEEILSVSADPVDGTTATATGQPEAMSVIAISKKDTMFATDEFYMLKLAVGPLISSRVKISLKNPIEEILTDAAIALGKPIDKLMVCMLNRPRHKNYLDRMRAIGVRIKLIADCDVSGAIATCRIGSGVDVLYGIGGAPEAVISAAAIKCLRGDFQCQIADANGNIKGDILKMEDLVSGPCAFAATGITTGSLLSAVKVENGKYETNSVFMRSESGTVRWLTTTHGN